MLPEGFKASKNGSTYPLPTVMDDLQKLASIPLQPGKQNSGNLYLRRALEEFRRRQARRTSAVLDVGFRAQAIKDLSADLEKKIEVAKADARAAVDGVRAQAEQAIASLNDLFALGRKGLEGQMQAHLAGSEWQGEKIGAAAFRDCFRMVTQAVKGLGLPSGERAKAAEAIMEEAAASLRATQEAVALAPGGDAGTSH